MKETVLLPEDADGRHQFLPPVGCLIGGHIDRTCDPVELPPKFARTIPVVYLDRDPFPANKQIFCAAHDSTETRVFKVESAAENRN